MRETSSENKGSQVNSCVWNFDFKSLFHPPPSQRILWGFPYKLRSQSAQVMRVWYTWGHLFTLTASNGSYGNHTIHRSLLKSMALPPNQANINASIS